MGRLLAAPRGYYGWVIVAVAFLTVAAALGTRASFGVLLVALVDAFGWGRGLTAGAISLNALVWALSAAPAGAMLDRWGPRFLFAGAAVLVGLGMALAAGTSEPWQLYLALGVIGGIGAAPLQANSQGVIIANWFVRRRGLANGVVASGVGLGVLALAPLTQWVIDRAGWQAACLTLAAIFLLVIAPLNALAQRHRPEDRGLLPDGVRLPTSPPSGAPGREDVSLLHVSQEAITTDAPASTPRAAAGHNPATGPSVREALRHLRYWALAGCFFFGALPLQFLLAHVVAHFVDVGFSPALAAGVLGLGGAGAAGGMVLWGYVADRWNSEWAYTLGSLALMGSIGVLYAVAPGREFLLGVFAALFALGFASRQGLHAFMAAALAQGRSLGTLMGILAVHVALGSTLGPALGGWMFDRYGSYGPAFAVCLVCATLAIGCAWVAAPRHGRLVPERPVPALLEAPR